ncbi:MAG TPA: hypothetical protein VMT52_14290 [Planctomycetota bacterium]|nr:hypothetical protein [Planctomycetota bacterium]
MEFLAEGVLEGVEVLPGAVYTVLVTTAFNEPRYHIDHSEFRCSTCAGEIPCDAHYYSAVYFLEEAFRRKDFCPPCWSGPAPNGAKETGGEDGVPAGREVPFAFWRTRRPPLPTDRPRRLHFDPELVFKFFQNLAGPTPAAPAPAAPGGNGDPAPLAGEGSEPPVFPGQVQREGEGLGVGERVELRFFLALILVRKKALVFVNAYPVDGKEWLKLTEKADPSRVHWVLNPELNDAQLEGIRVRLCELLHLEL